MSESKPQSKKTSLLESINAAAFAAPTAMGLHKLVLWIAGECTDVMLACNNDFVFLSWIIFFFHSIMWKYIIRRVYEKYDIELNPKSIYYKLKSKFSWK